MTAQLMQLLVGGVATGCVYALIALGFVLIYKATETVNFAQGDLMMVGGFVALAGMVAFGWSLWLVIPALLLAMAVLGMLMERLVLRPLLGQPAFTVIMVTIGIGFLLRGVVTMIPYWGTETHALEVPWRNVVLSSSGMVVSAEHVVIIGATALLVSLLYVFFKFTRLGIAMQATSQNQLAAFYMGIPVRRINMTIWGISAAVSGCAGLLLAPITFVHANMGFVGLKAFPAAVVGGFGSIPGALVGGLTVGLVESLAGFYLPEGFKDIAAYVVVLLMLAFKPSGLFGENTRKKV